MSQSRISPHRRHDAVTGKAATTALETLRPSVEVICEQSHTSRADRRHVRARNGAVLNVPKARQAPALNEPYRKPVTA